MTVALEVAEAHDQQATDLIARVRRRQAGALAELYESHVDGLYAFVFYRVGRSPRVAEDVVQDTFLRALEQLDRYDAERGSLRAWLCTLSRNVIRSHRQRQRVSSHDVEVWTDIDQTLAQLFDALDGAPLSDELIARAETQDMVCMTVANLPQHYGEVLQKKYVHGASVAELSAELDLSEDAVKSLLARARHAFRATFEIVSQAARST